MKQSIIRRAAIVHGAAAELRRHSFLAPILLAATALIVAACNNGSGGTGY